MPLLSKYAFHRAQPRASGQSKPARSPAHRTRHRSLTARARRAGPPLSTANVLSRPAHRSTALPEHVLFANVTKCGRMGCRGRVRELGPRPTADRDRMVLMGDVNLTFDDG